MPSKAFNRVAREAARFGNNRGARAAFLSSPKNTAGLSRREIRAIGNMRSGGGGKTTGGNGG